MAIAPVLILTLSLLLVLCSAAQPDGNLIFCKPRSILLRFRAETQFPIYAYRSCPTENGSFNCGGPFEDLVKVVCEEKACPPRVRCNRCRARILPRNFPRYYTTHSGEPVLGRYLFQFADNMGNCLFLEFDSDFENSGPEWFSRNKFVVGCRNRVSCLARKDNCIFKDPPFDLSISAQACDAQVYTTSTVTSTALSFRKCVKGDVTPPTNGVPLGEIIGTDCPARLL